MGENSKIEWCDHTFNPWIGCEKVSAGCDHCYAEALSKRTGAPELWQGQRRRTSVENWRLPLHWNQQAAVAGVRAKVFCASLADVFDNQIDAAWRSDLWHLIAFCNRLDWLLLTKRPQNLEKLLPPGWGGGWPHVWLGVTAETQAEAERRIPILCGTPAKRRFLSCEPLLGPIDLNRLQVPHARADCEAGDQPRESCLTDRRYNAQTSQVEGLRRIDWVIAGGESGNGARPAHPGWFRGLRDQCAAAGVPFHFKQWGEWAPCPRIDTPGVGSPQSVRKGDLFITPDGVTQIVGPDLGSNLEADGTPMRRLGKRLAGALLDGCEHRAVPATAVQGRGPPGGLADATPGAHAHGSV